jgi:hypothetical protein
VIAKNSIRAALTTAALSGAVALLAAPLEEDIRGCMRLEEPGRRLACFDQATARLSEPAGAPVDPARTGEPQQPGEADDPSFRFSPEPQAVPRPTTITSRHLGEFRGWSGDTVFPLENGQTWRQAEPGRVHWVKEAPVITITATSLGTFWLSVEGINARVRVRRVR